MNTALWNSLGHIGDDLISEADAETAATYFKHKKHRTQQKIRIITVAACICLLAAGLVMAIPMLRRSEPPINTENLIVLSEYKGSSGSEAECPTGPFQGLIGYQILTEKLGYDPGEPAMLVLSYGLVRELRHSGVIKAVIDTDIFSSDIAKEITVGRLNLEDHYGWEALKLQIPLIPPNERACGEIVIDFRFYPDNPNSDIFLQNQLDENGSLRLTRIEIPYIVNEFETAFSAYCISGRELFFERLPILYEVGKITAKQFSEMCCNVLYENVVFTEMNQRYISHNNSFRFRYYSKNIRYESPVINDYEMSMKRFQPKLFAIASLGYMIENGIITVEEYQRELRWLDEVEKITDEYDLFYNYGISLSEESNKALKENFLTH